MNSAALVAAVQATEESHAAEVAVLKARARQVASFADRLAKALPPEVAVPRGTAVHLLLAVAYLSSPEGIDLEVSGE